MGIGFLELVIIALAGLVLLGPQKIPELLRQVAKLYVHMRRTSNDLKSAFDHVVSEAEIELKKSELSQLNVPLEHPMMDTKLASSASEGHIPVVSASAPPPRTDGSPAWDAPDEKNSGPLT